MLPAAEIPPLRAQLVQKSTALAVPIGQPVDVTHDASGRAHAAVEIPRVERPSDFALRVEIRSERGGDWVSAGSVPLRVYPEDLLAPLRRWSRTHGLRVVDDAGELAALLERLEIPFRTRARSAAVTLYAGRRALEGSRGPIRPRAVVFAERERGLPHLVVSDRAEGRVVRVEIELLARLESDPRAQQTLLEIFELLEEPSSGAANKGEH